MKTNTALSFFLGAALLFSACSTMYNPGASWQNLPRAGAYSGLTNQRGAIITAPQAFTGGNIMGELLAVHGDTLLLLDRNGRVFEKTYFSAQQEGWMLHGLRPGTTTAAWAIPSSPALLIHGWFLAFTVPTAWVTGAINFNEERRAYGMLLMDVPLEYLRAYTRFPMGVPEDYRPEPSQWGNPSKN